MIAPTTTHSPCPGQLVQVRIAARLIRDQESLGWLIDYMGTRFTVDRGCLTVMIDRDDRLARVVLDAVVVERRGRVSYIVAHKGTQITVHEQNILASEVVG